MTRLTVSLALAFVAALPAVTSLAQDEEALKKDLACWLQQIDELRRVA